MTWETTTEHQNEKRKSSMLQPKIQPSDGLSFRTCTVFIFMVLQSVGGAVSTPVIEFVSNQSREVVLQCEAKGWYPEPELFWLDGEGNLLSAGPTETVRGPDDLYTVSRRLTVRKSDSFTCRVQQKNINQTRETHFYVPEDFFMVQSLSQTEFIIIIIISTIIFTLCCICIAVLVVNGRLISESQNPSYHYRTRLFVDELKNGNVSMKISRVKLSDAGKYFCILSSMQKVASIQLTVGAVSTPVIEFVSNQSRKVVLQCEAKGWYPEPELFWLDGEGNLLSAGPTETVRGPDDLYTVSRRLTVRKSDSFTCRVQQKNINQTRETHVYVPEDFFTVQSLRQPEFIILIIIISTIIFTLCCICIAFLVASVQNLLYKRNNGEHHVKQLMLNIQERPKVKKRDAKEAAHELRPMLKRKKQQEEQQEQQEEQREQLEEQREQLEGQREQPEEQREQPEEQREQPEEQREQPEEQREQPEEQQEQLEEEREQREQLEEEQEQLEEEQEQLEEQ
ncbi:Butyrophilin-like protein 2 [Nibea albiflora]|uniref:Butyrophilin-like protein 2 n=1 Tax=Nibea albiflora TaxID=240163 RepID=A0ACB7EUQ8_NIBAL|nr:Butyrophilin-like protein 2 [Nibea albiflora]